MAFDEPMPTPDGNTVATMTDWEAYWVGGLGGAAGVISGVGGALSPSINSGARTVSLASGAALVRGFYVNNPSTYTASVPAQSAGDRVDRLVLRLDRTAVTAANWLKPVIIQGTSGSPIPPALQATDNNSWDLTLARWTTKADGTLAGLADERVLMGGGFVTFRSGAQPPASPPRVGFELDTGRVLYANGTVWSPVIDDTGWVTVPIIGHWRIGGYTPQIRCRAGTVYFRGSVERTTDTLQSTVTNSQIATLSAAFLPAGTHNYASVTSSVGPVRLQVGYTGAVALVDAGVDIPVGRVVYLDSTWLKG